MPLVLYLFVQGEKIFYLIKPTKTNLALYESWSSSVNQSEVFFGEKVEKCYKCVVKQGTTVLLPTGQTSFIWVLFADSSLSSPHKILVLFDSDLSWVLSLNMLKKHRKISCCFATNSYTVSFQPSD